MPTVAPMKPFRALIALVALCASLQTPAGADTQINTFAPVYTLNNGTTDFSKTCTSAEWSLIQTAVGGALGSTGGSSYRRREMLRSPNSSHRNLGLKCSNCGGKPLCLATIGRGCALLGKRRRLDELDSERSLSTSNPCASQITAVDAALNTTKASVSAPCQALLSTTPDIQCAEYTYDCNIYGLTVIIAKNATVVTKLNTTGTPSSYCASVGLVTIRAETNFFLGSVNFTMVGKRFDNFTRRFTYKVGYRPYAFNGGFWISARDNRTSPVYQKFVYHNMPANIPGVYNITAYSLDDPSSGLTATYIVKDC